MFSSVFCTFATLILLATPAALAADPVLNVVLKSGAAEKPLKTWDGAALKKLKNLSSQEKDPVTGEIVSWKGVSLAALIDQSLESLTVEERAKIDLVILKNEAGAQAFVPRSLINLYPVLLAWDRSGGLGTRGPWYTVVPWSSRPKMLKEILPFERYFMPSLTRVELANRQSLYGAYYLSNRGNPSAMRGEKIFVQNCLGCHSPDQVPKITTADSENRGVASRAEHAKGAPKLDARDWRALLSYFAEYRAEVSKVNQSN
jgi:hypothetical protein